eukprot:jgi/Mesvir1/26845/Mv20597-RA.2
MDTSSDSGSERGGERNEYEWDDGVYDGVDPDMWEGEVYVPSFGGDDENEEAILDDADDQSQALESSMRFKSNGQGVPAPPSVMASGTSSRAPLDTPYGGTDEDASSGMPSGGLSRMGALNLSHAANATASAVPSGADALAPGTREGGDYKARGGGQSYGGESTSAGQEGSEAAADSEPAPAPFRSNSPPLVGSRAGFGADAGDQMRVGRPSMEGGQVAAPEEPEPLNTEDAHNPMVVGIVLAFKERTARCLLSRTWSLRAAGVKDTMGVVDDVSEELMGRGHSASGSHRGGAGGAGPDASSCSPDQVFRAACGALERVLADPVLGVYTQAIQLLLAVVNGLGPHQAKPEVNEHMSRLLPALVARLGDSNVRVRGASTECLAKLSRTPTVGAELVLAAALKAVEEQHGASALRQVAEAYKLCSLVIPDAHMSNKMPDRLLASAITGLQSRNTSVRSAALELLVTLRGSKTVAPDALKAAVSALNAQLKKFIADHMDLQIDLGPLAITGAGGSSNSATGGGNDDKGGAGPLSLSAPGTLIKDLPVPEPLSVEDQRMARPLMEVFGEHVVQCFFAKAWASAWQLRELAIRKVAQDLDTYKQSPNTVLHAAFVLVGHGMADSVSQVYIAALQLLQLLAGPFARKHNLRKDTVGYEEVRAEATEITLFFFKLAGFKRMEQHIAMLKPSIQQPLKASMLKQGKRERKATDARVLTSLVQSFDAGEGGGDAAAANLSATGEEGFHPGGQAPTVIKPWQKRQSSKGAELMKTPAQKSQIKNRLVFS